MFRNFLKAFFFTLCLLFADKAMAVTQMMTAHIAFATPASATQDADFNIKAGEAGAYNINEGRIIMAGATDQTINISVDSYNPDGGVAPRNATCSYDGDNAGPCEIKDGAAPGTGKAFTLNVQSVAGDVADEDRAAASAFTVSVVYQ
jgi:hypothetical protein